MAVVLETCNWNYTHTHTGRENQAVPSFRERKQRRGDIAVWKSRSLALPHKQMTKALAG